MERPTRPWNLAGVTLTRARDRLRQPWWVSGKWSYSIAEHSHQVSSELNIWCIRTVSGWSKAKFSSFSAICVAGDTRVVASFMATASQGTVEANFVSTETRLVGESFLKPPNHWPYSNNMYHPSSPKVVADSSSRKNNVHWFTYHTCWFISI